MLNLQRLLELAGLVEDLPPARPDTLSREEALRIFARYGEPVLSGDDPKIAWKKLARVYHEAGSSPNPQAWSWINRAYGVLKSQKAPAAMQGFTNFNQDAEPYEVWGWDGRFLMPGYKIEATPAQFGEVVTTAMQRLRQGFKRPSSILLRTDREWLLIYHQGHMIDPPADYPSVGSPGNDRRVAEWLSTYR